MKLHFFKNLQLLALGEIYQITNSKYQLKCK